MQDMLEPLQTAEGSLQMGLNIFSPGVAFLHRTESSENTEETIRKDFAPKPQKEEPGQCGTASVRKQTSSFPNC